MSFHVLCKFTLNKQMHKSSWKTDPYLSVRVLVEIKVHAIHWCQVAL